MRVGSLFSGHGQLDVGLHLAGLEHAWFCEADPFRRDILAKRWPGVPVFDDVRAVDRSAPRVDLLAGGFPCRGGSTAGKREGMGNPETALWREMARTIGELRPRLVLLENVANLLAVQRGAAWGEVVGDLASLRYVCAWDCLPAAAFGAPHLRDRVFGIAADADALGWDKGTEWSAQGTCSGPRKDGQAAQRGSAPDPSSQDGQGAHGRRAALGRAPGIDRTSIDPDQGALWEQPEPEQGGGSAAEPGIAGGQWGSYAAAVHRWEEIAGPAPEPLLRGVDARFARRVVRSRLSALGDGVQVQAGLFLGQRILDFERGGIEA